jgi:hypothetical protein
MSVWLGPAHSGGDEDTLRDIPIHYSTHTLDNDTYVTATHKHGATYVMPWECPEEIGTGS